MKKARKIIDFDSAPDIQLVGINHACSLLDVSRSTFYRLVKADKLRLIKVGCGSKISVEDLRRLVAAAA